MSDNQNLIQRIKIAANNNANLILSKEDIKALAKILGGNIPLGTSLVDDFPQMESSLTEDNVFNISKYNDAIKNQRKKFEVIEGGK